MRVCRQCWCCRPFHRREFSGTGCSPVATVGGSSATATGGGGGCVGGAASCCHMARWRWDNNTNNKNNNCFLSSTVVFFIGSFVVYGFIGAVYAWLFINPHASMGMASSGCLPDSEGSWAIGVFYGDSPFSLRPIEAVRLDFPLFLFFFLKISLILGSGYLWIFVGLFLEFFFFFLKCDRKWLYSADECVEKREFSVACGQSCRDMCFRF